MVSTNNSPPTIFLSYCHKNMDIADEIDNSLQPFGVILTRDVRDVKYRDSISKFMKKIKETDFVIILISDDFLKSVNCMYEVIELLKVDNYKERVLPIRLNSLGIFTTEGILEYVRYWTMEEEKIRKELDKEDSLAVAELREDHRIINEIRLTVGEFLTKIKDLNCKTYKEIKTAEYIDILNIIGIEEKQILKEISKIKKIEDMEDKELALESLLEKYPTHKSIKFYRAYLYKEKKEFKKSRKYYEELINSYKDFVVAYNNLGILLANDYFKDYDEARKSYEKAIELDPAYVKAYYNLGNLLSNDYFKDYDEARKSYEKAIELDPAYVKAYNNLGILLENDYFKDYDEARKSYEKAIELNPAHFNAYYNLGILLANDYFKDYDEARKSYEKAIELDPAYVKAYYNLGSLLAQYFPKEYDKAKELLEKAKELDSNMNKR